MLAILAIPGVCMLLLTNRNAYVSYPIVPIVLVLILSPCRRALCGLFGLFPLHTLYPLMKRWTYWPQAWLGLAMNWGFPVAWLSITGGTLSAIDVRVVVAFFLGTVW